MSLSRGITKLQGMYNVQQQIHEYTHLNWIYEIHICISGLFARCRGLKAERFDTHIKHLLLTNSNGNTGKTGNQQ